MNESTDDLRKVHTRHDECIFEVTYIGQRAVERCIICGKVNRD